MNKVIKLEDTKIYNVILEVFKDDYERLNEIVKNLNKFVKKYPESFEESNTGLSSCFVWANSEQGHRYWSEIDAVIDSYLVNKEKGMKPAENWIEIQGKEDNIISMDKQYTVNGSKAVIACVDFKGKYPVVAVVNNIPYMYTKEGKYGGCSHGIDTDLKEYSPWQDVSTDTKVIVKFFDEEEYPRHFSHYKDGVVHVFTDGNTSFTTTYTTSVSSARLA